MSSWVYNQLSVRGTPEEVQRFAQEAKGCLPKGYVTFDRDLLKVVEEMEKNPDWASADQTIQHQRNQIKEKYVPQEVHFLYGESLNGEFLEFIPFHLANLEDERQRRENFEQWASQVRKKVRRRERDPSPPRQHLSLYQLAPIPEEALNWSFHFLGKEIQNGLWGTNKDAQQCSQADFTSIDETTEQAHWTFSTWLSPPSKAIATASENWPNLYFSLAWCSKEGGGRQGWNEGIALHKPLYFKAIEIPSAYLTTREETYIDSNGVEKLERWTSHDVVRVLQWQSHLLWTEIYEHSQTSFEHKKKIKELLPILTEMGSLLSLLHPEQTQNPDTLAKEAQEILQSGGDLQPIEELLSQLKSLYRSLRKPSF
ncbi:MAG: hypothetical protein VX278_09410 [Myxococcota bacterium]|nr:hypothetical protein [Myxococcota bacterium]